MLLIGKFTAVVPTYSRAPPSLVLTSQGNRPPLSVAKIRRARPTFFRLLTQAMWLAFALALARGGQEHAGENRDDRDHHEEFDQRECADFLLTETIHNFWCV